MNTTRAQLAACLVLAAAGIVLLTLAAGPDTTPPQTAPPQTSASARQPSASPSAARFSTPPAATRPASPNLQTSRAPAAPVRELPPPGAGPVADRWVQRALADAVPADLPAATERRLVTLGRAVWTAETTGTGRDRWPGYFHPSATPAAIYGRFRIQAAIARRTSPGRVVVHMVWAGADPAGSFRDGRTATVHLTNKETGLWTPAR